MTADYSQIEMRIMAHLSEDAGLIEAFNTGEDLHSFVGSRAFGVPIDEVTVDMRRRVKAMSYGLAYGSARSVWPRSSRSAPPRPKNRWTRTSHASAGSATTCTRRSRRRVATNTPPRCSAAAGTCPISTATTANAATVAERAALNAPIQGTAADIIKVAMIDVQRSLADTGLTSRMLLQVHDELVFEVAPGERDQLEELVRAKMGGAIELSVPLDVSVGYGRSWDEAAH